MRYELDKIYARIDKNENKEKKQMLIFHTSTTKGGECIFCKLERARWFLNELESNSNLKNSVLYTEFYKDLKFINKWLDDNNWVK